MADPNQQALEAWRADRDKRRQERLRAMSPERVAWETNTPVEEVRRLRALGELPPSASPTPTRANRNNLRDESSSFSEMNNPRGLSGSSSESRRRNLNDESSSFMEMNNPRGTGSSVPAQTPSRPSPTQAPSRSSIEDAARRTMTDPNYSDTANQAGRMMADEVSRQLETNTARRQLAARRPTTRMSPSSARGNEMSADDLNALSLTRGVGADNAPDTAAAANIRRRLAEMEPGMKKGGRVKKMAKGGVVKVSASRRGDGCATKGKTKGRMV